VRQGSPVAYSYGVYGCRSVSAATGVSGCAFATSLDAATKVLASIYSHFQMSLRRASPKTPAVALLKITATAKVLAQSVVNPNAQRECSRPQTRVTLERSKPG